MLKIYQSNQMEALVELLAAKLAASAPAMPVLAQQKVLVQSQGMRQWLTIRLAEYCGIAANLDTPMPAAFLWQLSRDVLGEDLPDTSAFDKRAMTWKLMSLISDLRAEPWMTPLGNFLGDSHDEQLRRYQLASRIADIFDQYLVYRPDWIAAWEAGDEPAACASQPWQGQLWRALVARSQSLSQHAGHRANLHDEVIKRLRAGRYDEALIPPWLGVFGISALPPQQLEMLMALGERRDLDLFLMNPCQHYWGDIVPEKSRARTRAAKLIAQAKGRLGADDYLTVGNPLLASWGAQGREFIDLLLQYPEAGFEDGFVEGPPTRLLEHVQHEILTLQVRGELDPQDAARLPEAEGKYLVAPEDKSLSLHNCYSRLREVEVLHDQVLARLEADPTLSLRDMIVMAPDIAAYAPLVAAVFGGSQAERPALRYSLSDRTVADESPLLNSFMLLLGLPLSRFSAAEFLDLLSAPAVAARFGISDAEREQLAIWLAGAGVRWGWDADAREELGLPPENQNTWQFGLERLFLGYASSQDSLIGNTLPYPEVEGSSAELLGRAARLARLVRSLQLTLNQSRSLADWQLLLETVFADFFQGSEEELAELDTVRSAMSAAVQLAQANGFDEPLGYTVFRFMLVQAIAQPANAYAFLSGGLSFCTLMPMRSIPFKHVFLIGMNSDDFPRTEYPPGFDLMAKSSPRQGDRSRRHDDRYQVLEALLSARDSLSISYVGRDKRSGEQTLPALPIAELQDYCELVAHWERGGLETLHPLQPFDEAYFDASNPALFSYQADNARAASSISNSLATPFFGTALAATSTQGTIQLGELLSFYANPARYLLRNRLKVWFDLYDDEPPDVEPFAITGLDKYHLEQAAMDAARRGDKQPLWAAYTRAEGKAPVGAAGDIALQSVWDSSAPIGEQLAEASCGDETFIQLALSVGSFELGGVLGPVYDGSLLYGKPGDISDNHLLPLWIKHLCAAASGSPVESRWFGGNGSGRFSEQSANVAVHCLESLLDVYQGGICSPSLFIPKTSLAWHTKFSQGDRDRALTDAHKAWGGYDNSGEGSNFYYQRVYDIDTLLGEPDFSLIAEQVYGPLQQAKEVDE